MSYETDKERVKELLTQIKPGTIAERLAWVYLARYEHECRGIVTMGCTAEHKMHLVEDAHTRYLGMLCHLVEPLVPDEQTAADELHSTQETAIGLSIDFNEVLTALAGIIKAWDEVEPIGWVAKKKAEPGVILGAVKQARAVLARFKHYVPS